MLSWEVLPVQARSVDTAHRPPSVGCVAHRQGSDAFDQVNGRLGGAPMWCEVSLGVTCHGTGPEHKLTERRDLCFVL
jgi:hypothetical protein